jgi:hypothetical protein
MTYHRKRAPRATRRHAWSHIVPFVTGAVLILATLFITGFNAGR